MSASGPRTRVVLVLTLALSLACAENPTAPSALATKLEAVSSTTMTAVVGSAVNERPSVIVRDDNGAPIARVPVTFVLLSGSGSLNGASVVTNAAGKATIGQWILSKTAGSNIVSARTGSLTVDFSATGIAGPPAILVKTSGDNQFALPGTAVPIPPAVLVTDANDNAVSGARVDFTIASGDGSITGATVTSNSEGVARLGGWTLGADGTQSVRAVVDGATPALFTATATTNPCKVFPELAPGSSATVMLSALDCPLADGRYGNFFAFRADSGKAYTVDQTSATFDTNLTLMTRSGVPVAEAGVAGSPRNAGFKVFLAGGDYVLRAASRAVGQFGQYTILAAPAPESVNDCQEMFVTTGVSTSQSLGKGDCGLLGQPEDHYRIYLQAGTKIIVTMSSTQVDTRVELSDSKGRLVADAEENVLNTIDSRLVFTVATSGYYLINATTGYGFGDYTLTIE